MIRLKMTAEGIARLESTFRGMTTRLRPEVERVVKAYAQKIRSDAINSMRRSTPSGRTYKIKGKRKKAREHRASAPGQPPAVDTGRLWSSITADFRDDGLTGEVGPTVFYGKYLELGTSRMAPRPFMEPALEQNEPGFIRAVREAVDKATR